MYPQTKANTSRCQLCSLIFFFNSKGVIPLFLKHQYITDITDNAQLIFICGTVSAVHVRERLVSLSSLKGTTTSEDFNVVSKRQPSSELVRERPKRTTSEDDLNGGHTHMLRQSNGISRHCSSRGTTFKNSFSHRSSKKSDTPQVFNGGRRPTRRLQPPSVRTFCGQSQINQPPSVRTFCGRSQIKTN